MDMYDDINTSQLPKSGISDNSYKNFLKISRAYENELMHIAKNQPPSLSKDDVIVLDDLIKEITAYAAELTKQNYSQYAKKLIEIGLKIVDYLLKVFNVINQQKNLQDKLNFPLTLKLILLEAYFGILFKNDKNYFESEKVIKDIIEIQKDFLGLPQFNIACSTFYLGVLKFYLNEIDNAEQYFKKALEMLERKDSTQGDEKFENRKTRKMSNILEFLAEIYNLKKEYQKELDSYEKAYYLNLGRYGGKNVNTEYFKMKLEIANEEVKKYTHYSPYNKMGVSQPNYGASSSGFNKANNDVSTTSYHLQNIMHKGKTDSFSFKIPTSSFYEPLLISVYSQTSDDDKRYSPELFVCNLIFDKMKILKYLQEKEASNSVIYSDEALNKILSCINLINTYVTFLDPNLKMALINSNNNQQFAYPAIVKKK